MARWYEKLFPVLEELDIGYVAFSPLANGFLSAKYDKNSSFDKALDYRSMMPQFTEKGMEQNAALLELLAKIASEKMRPPRRSHLLGCFAKSRISCLFPERASPKGFVKTLPPRRFSSPPTRSGL